MSIWGTAPEIDCPFTFLGISSPEVGRRGYLMTKRTLVAWTTAAMMTFGAVAAKAADTQPLVFSDWLVNYGNDKSFIFAATVNDSGEIFGEYCYFAAKTCNWYMQLHNVCISGSQYYILANSDARAAPLTIECKGGPQNGLYAEQFQDWKTLEANIADSIHIGFAIPIKEDKFNVVRFSLNGRTQATSAMEAVFFGAAQTGQQGTVDSTL